MKFVQLHCRGDQKACDAYYLQLNENQKGIEMDSNKQGVERVNLITNAEENLQTALFIRTKLKKVIRHDGEPGELECVENKEIKVERLYQILDETYKILGEIDNLVIDLLNEFGVFE